jgi:hypothetical protein
MGLLGIRGAGERMRCRMGEGRKEGEDEKEL